MKVELVWWWGWWWWYPIGEGEYDVRGGVAKALGVCGCKIGHDWLDDGLVLRSVKHSRCDRSRKRRGCWTSKPSTDIKYRDISSTHSRNPLAWASSIGHDW